MWAVCKKFVRRGSEYRTENSNHCSGGRTESSAGHQLEHNLNEEEGASLESSVHGVELGGRLPNLARATYRMCRPTLAGVPWHC